MNLSTPSEQRLHTLMPIFLHKVNDRMKINPPHSDYLSLFKKSLVWLACLAGMTNSIRSQAQPPRITLTDETGQVAVTFDGKPFTRYIYQPDLMAGCKKPVLFPILTARGTAITRGFPIAPRPGERVDHPHHVGMWLNYGDVNGHDFWNNSDNIGPEHKGPFGTIRHTGKPKIKQGKGRAQLTVTADWLDKDGNPMLRETTVFTFSGDSVLRMIDRATTLTALEKDVSLKDNKEGLVAIRVARQLEHPSEKPEILTDASGKATPVPVMDNTGVTGRYRSSEGTEGEAVWGKRAKWMNLTGEINGEAISVAMLDHPRNAGYPAYWHARGYGLYAANPLGAKAFTEGKEELNFRIAAGKSATFRYRMVVASKKLTDAELNGLSADFAK